MHFVCCCGFWHEFICLVGLALSRRAKKTNDCVAHLSLGLAQARVCNKVRVFCASFFIICSPFILLPHPHYFSVSCHHCILFSSLLYKPIFWCALIQLSIPPSPSWFCVHSCFERILLHWRYQLRVYRIWSKRLKHFPFCFFSS